MSRYMAAAGLQEAHDLLMANKPEDAEHDSTTCPLCALKSSLIEPGETVSEAKYTEEDAKALVSAAVAEATAPLAAQIAALTADEAAEAVAADKAAAVEAVQVEADAKIAELTSKLDEAVLATAAVQAAHDALVAEKEAAEQAALQAERSESRVATVKEKVAFPDEHFTEDFTARLVAMDDEQFEAQVADWAVLAPKTDKSGKGGIPSETGFQASQNAELAGKGSALGELTAIRSALR